jgi:hypothetical protein
MDYVTKLLRGSPMRLVLTNTCLWSLPTYTMGSTSFHLGRIEEWTQSTSYINLSDVGFI